MAAEWVIVRLKDHDQKVELRMEAYPQIGEKILHEGGEYTVLSRYFENGQIHYDTDGPATRKAIADMGPIGVSFP